MSLVNFVHRSSKPTNPVAGTFYWVDENAGHKIYFAPDDNAEHLLLLNDERWVSEIESLLLRLSDDEERISANEGDIEWIKTRLGELKDEILGEIDLTPYLIEDDLVDYAKKNEIPTKVSELENDRGYLVDSDLDGYAREYNIPTKVSELENDRGYLTVGDLPDVDLGDSDWGTIINIVKEETNEIVNDKLTWKII